MSVTPKALVALPDQLVDLTFNSQEMPIERRLAAFNGVSERIGELIVRNWRPDSEQVQKVMRASTFLACVPSLWRTLNSEPQDIQGALEVYEGFQGVSEAVLDEDFSRELRARCHLETGFRRLVKGQMAETGVLGIIWWGIANGVWPENTYALPATHKEDSRRLKDGRSLATDIIMRRSGSKQRLPIQVKNQFAYKPTLDDYHNEIVLVAAEDLVGLRKRNKTDIPEKLLGMLAQEDTAKLRRGAQHIARLMDRKKAKPPQPAAKLSVPFWYGVNRAPRNVRR